MRCGLLTITHVKRIKNGSSKKNNFNQNYLYQSKSTISTQLATASELMKNNIIEHKLSQKK